MAISHGNHLFGMSYFISTWAMGPEYLILVLSGCLQYCIVMVLVGLGTVCPHRVHSDWRVYFYSPINAHYLKALIEIEQRTTLLLWRQPAFPRHPPTSMPQHRP